MSRSNPNAYLSCARLLPFAALAAILSVTGSGSAATGGGEAFYFARHCDGCHGQRGRYPAIPLYPRLGGQNAAYLYPQMRDIRDGKRTNGMSAAMRATVSQVTDEELKAIADWLAGQ